MDGLQQHTPPEQLKPASLWPHSFRFLLISVFWLLTGMSGVAEQGFQVCGKMVHSRFEGGKYEVKSSWTFEMSVLGSQWLHTIRQTNGVDIVEGSDGNSFFSLTADRNGIKKHNLKRLGGSVFPGTYPVLGGVESTMPWLAYASGEYMQWHVTNGHLAMPAPWLVAAFMPLAHIFTVHYHPMTTGHLPKTLEFIPSSTRIREVKEGKAQVLSVVDDIQRRNVLKQLQSFEGINEPKVIFQVEKTTNFHDWMLPAQFSIKLYAFHRAQSGPVRGSLPLDQTIGEMTSIKAIASLDPYPKSTIDIKDVDVSDYRFFNAATRLAFVPYTATNAQWIIQSSDARLKALEASYTSIMATISPQINVPKSKIIHLVLILLALVPFLILWGQRRTKKTTSSTEQTK